MTGAFANATIIVSLVVAAWALVHLLIARPMSRWLHSSQLVIAAMFAVLALGGIVQMLGTDRDFARIEFVGYLVISPIIPIGSWFPRATVWSGFGVGYALIPLILPIVGLWWLRRERLRGRSINIESD